MTPIDGAWLAATVAIFIPLLLAATGEIVSQRCGVLNIGLEGFMLCGAFAGIWVAVLTDGNVFAGLVAAGVAGTAIAALMALVSIRFGADQVVAGVGINLFALGLTGFLVDQSATEFYVGPADPLSIPFLSDLPFIGKALFEQHPSTYATVAVLVLTWWCMARTNLGILIRSCGDYPSAADSAGHNVNRTRALAAMFSGLTAGVAGALVSVVDVGTYQDNMIGGRGFLVLAAIVLSRWHHGGAILAVALFAAADALQLRLQALGHTPVSLWVIVFVVPATILAFALFGKQKKTAFISGVLTFGAFALLVLRPEIVIPFQFWRALPFVVTLVFLASITASSGEPRYLTQPFKRR